MPPELPRPRPRDRQVSAGFLSALAEGLEALAASPSPDGGHFAGQNATPIAGRPLFLAMITAKDDSLPPRHSWTWWQHARTDGVATVEADAVAGGPASPSGLLPAYEIKGRTDVPVDGTAIVEMWPSWGGECYEFEWFGGPGGSEPLSITSGVTLIDVDIFGRLALYLTPTANLLLTGLAGGTVNQTVWIFNTSSTFSVTLPHGSTSSTPGNRIQGPTGTDVVIPPFGITALTYNGSVWVVTCPQTTTAGPGLPTAISSTPQNDYPVTSNNQLVTVISITTSGVNPTITGLAPPTGVTVPTGWTLTLTNGGPGFLTLTNQDPLSTTPNRIVTPAGTSITVPLGGMVTLVYGIPIAGRWNVVTTNQGLPLQGGTLTGLLTTMPGTTGTAPLNMPNGVAPSSPVTGDIWSDGTDIYANVNGVTYNLTDAAEAAAVGLRWVKITKSHTDFQTAATTNTITIYTKGATEIVHGVKIKHSTIFAGGGGMATYTLTGVGLSGSGDGFYYSVTQSFTGAVTDTNGKLKLIGIEYSVLPSATAVTASVSSNVNLSNSTAGSVDIWLLVSTPQAATP